MLTTLTRTRRPPAMSSYPVDPFVGSRRAFDALVGRLTAEETAHIDHDAIERIFGTDGAELLRLLYDDHLELRSVREESTIQPMVGSDSERRTEHRRGSRKLGTPFGPVTARRLALVKGG